MEDDPVGPLGIEDRQGVLPCLSDVDHEGFPRLAGEGDVRPECALLILDGREAPVIVETGFAHPDHQPIREELLDDGPRGTIELGGRVGVDPSGREDPPEGLGQLG